MSRRTTRIRYANPAQADQGSLYAPRRGVSIRGQFHQGGEQIPLDVFEHLTEDEAHDLIGMLHQEPARARNDFVRFPTPAKEEPPQAVGRPHYTAPDETLDEPEGPANALPQTPEQGRGHLGYAGDFISDEEAMTFSPGQARSFVELFNRAAPASHFAVGAKMGRRMRGWYRNTALALNHLFGPDAPRFAALLAATSPQKSVAANLNNALHIWREFLNLKLVLKREPTPAEVRQWARRRQNDFGPLASQLEGTGAYHTGSEVPNIVRALSGGNPGDPGTLSGPKVDSFQGNVLFRDLWRVTNDTWQALFAGVDQSDLKGVNRPDSVGGRDLPGGAYAALSAKARMAAQMLNQDLAPGERPWHPLEVQEATWALTRGLAANMGQPRYDLRGLSTEATAHLVPDPIQALDDMTHEDIAGNVNFADLIAEFPEVLEELGHGEAVGRLREALRGGEEASPPPSGPVAAGLSPADRAVAERIARNAAVGTGRMMSPVAAYAKKKRKRLTPEELDAREAKVRRRPRSLWYNTPADQAREFKSEIDLQNNHHQNRPQQFAATGALVATSNNKDADMSFESALQRARSGDQKVFKQHLEQMIQQQGLKAKTESAVGDWEDGAEHSLLSTFDGHADPATVKYLAAWSGLLGNQRAVLSFVPDPQGLDSVYAVEIPETNLGRVRQSLSQAGIPFRTIVPGKRGARVVIYDQKRQLRDQVSQWAGAYRAAVRESIGSGEYVGGGSRSDARRKYRDIIARYEEARGQDARGQVRAG